MINKQTHFCLLSILLVLFISACDKENSTLQQSTNSSQTASTSSATPSKTRGSSSDASSSLAQKTSKKGVNVDKLIGASLLAYPEFRPVNDDFSKSLFRNRAQLSDKNASMPIYRIELDHKALAAATEKLKRKFNLTEQRQKDGVVIYSNGKKVLAVRDEIGSLRFRDLELFQLGEGVKEVDKEKVLKVAQGLFEELIPSDLLKQTYFYRYGENINSASEGETLLPERTYELEVALNSTVDGIPVIGSGGKYGLGLKPDGQIASIDMQFARFTKTGDIVKIKDSTSVLEQTKKEAEDLGISFDKYMIPRAEFGYMYQSKKGPMKWLVPSYSIFVTPNEGVAGSATSFYRPASDDPIARQRFDEDLHAEENRKAFHYEDREVPVEDKKAAPSTQHSPTFDDSQITQPIDTQVLN